MTLLLMSKVFPARRWKQMIMTSISDVTVTVLTKRVVSIQGEADMSSRLSSGFLGAVHLSYLVRSHQPSVAATLVPLME